MTYETPQLTELDADLQTAREELRSHRQRAAARREELDLARRARARLLFPALQVQPPTPDPQAEMEPEPESEDARWPLSFGGSQPLPNPWSPRQ
jgi:hypothetical protein